MIVRANAPRRVSARVKVLVVLLAAIAMPAWLQPQESERSRSRDDGNATARSGPKDGESAIQTAPRDGDARERAGTRDGDRPTVRRARDGESSERPVARDGDAAVRRSPREGDRPTARTPQERRGGAYASGGSSSSGSRRGYSFGGSPSYGRSGGGYGSTGGASGGGYGSTSGRESASSGLEGFRPQNAREAALLQMIRQLQREMVQLRREVNQLRTTRPMSGYGGREGDRPANRRQEGIGAWGGGASGDVLVRPRGASTNAPREP